MGTPQSNGLFEVIGTKEPIERGFFCMKLVGFLNKEAELGTEQYGILWEQRFDEAKKGQCAYREQCLIYAKTKKRPVQLNLF